MAENDVKKDGNDADEASAPEAKPEAKPRPGRGGAFVLGAVVVVALVAAAAALVIFEPRLRTRVGTWFDGDAIGARAALDARLTELGRRVDGLEGRIAGLPAPIDAKRIEALETRLAALPPGVGAGRVAALEDRLKALEAHRAATSQQAAKGATVPPGALVLVALARRLDLGRPFADLSAKGNAALEGLGAGATRDVLAALAPYAEKGVPTASTLARVAAGFMAAPVVKETPASPPVSAPAADGWWAAIRARIAGLVTVRRIGEDAPAPASLVPAKEASDILRPAVKAFAAGDVAGARAVLAGIAPGALSPADAARLARLIADTDARRRADHLSTALDAALAALP
jgi:hypothetical protein